MLDQWYKMQRLYGTTEAHARWNDMYGDDFLALTSVTGSEKVTGLQPNNASWRMLKDHPDLVKKIVDVSGDPTTIQLLMGNQGYAQTPDNEYWAARRNMQHYKPPGLDTTAITGKTLNRCWQSTVWRISGAATATPSNYLPMRSRLC